MLQQIAHTNKTSVRPFPKAIEFQTITACNAGCVICPHPQTSKEIPGGRMAEEIFYKLLKECQAHQEGLRIIPYLNAEPFLDKRFIGFLKDINEYCPKAEVEVSTNVSMLSSALCDRLTQVHITELRLSVFGFSAAVHKAMMPGLHWTEIWRNLLHIVSHPGLRKSIDRIGIVMIEHPFVKEKDISDLRAFCQEWNVECNEWGFLDRAQNVKKFSNNKNNSIIIGCEQSRPHERLHVRFNGNVILCCQDWRDEIIIGNITHQSIQEVWTSQRYQQIRDAVTSGRPNGAPDICRRCKLAVCPQ